MDASYPTADLAHSPPYRIGISGINAVDNPGPGVGVARSLLTDRSLDIEILGLAYGVLEPGIYMDWVVPRSFTLPFPSGNGHEFVQRLVTIHKRHGLDAVIPCLDSELPIYIRYANELRAEGIETFLPTMSQFKLRSKECLDEIAQVIGIKSPRTAIARSEAELHEAVAQIGLPAFIKGAFYDARRAYTVADAVAHFRSLAAEWGYPILVQEVLRGEERNVVGVGDGAGGSLGSVGVRKVTLSAQGKMWAGVTVQNPILNQAASNFVEHYKWRGPFELECLEHEGELYLIEINPRFPAWIYLAQGVGINLPARMVRHLRGESNEPCPEYPAGKLFLRYSYEMITDMNRMQHLLVHGETP